MQIFMHTYTHCDIIRWNIAVVKPGADPFFSCHHGRGHGTCAFRGRTDDLGRGVVDVHVGGRLCGTCGGAKRGDHGGSMARYDQFHGANVVKHGTSDGETYMGFIGIVWDIIWDIKWYNGEQGALLPVSLSTNHFIELQQCHRQRDITKDDRWQSVTVFWPGQIVRVQNWIRGRLVQKIGGMTPPKQFCSMRWVERESMKFQTRVDNFPRAN